MSLPYFFMLHRKYHAVHWNGCSSQKVLKGANNNWCYCSCNLLWGKMDSLHSFKTFIHRQKAEKRYWIQVNHGLLQSYNTSGTGEQWRRSVIKCLGNVFLWWLAADPWPSWLPPNQDGAGELGVRKSVSLVHAEQEVRNFLRTYEDPNTGWCLLTVICMRYLRLFCTAKSLRCCLWFDVW